MNNIKELVEGLMNPNDNTAYLCLKKLEEKSLQSDEVYPFLDQFVQMLNHPNSYVRTRGIRLIAANAKWDNVCKIDEVIDLYLGHISDEKPITARQCIKGLPIIVKYKPDLKQSILDALYYGSDQKYKESMQTLVIKDIQEALKEINLVGKGV